MRKDYRIKKNGDSIQVYDLQGYAGSIPLKDLCRIVRNRQNAGTETLLAQKEPIQKDVEKPQKGTGKWFKPITLPP